MHFYNNGFKFYKNSFCIVLFNFYLLDCVLCCSQQIIDSECSSSVLFNAFTDGTYVHRRHGGKNKYQNIFQYSHPEKQLVEEKQNLQIDETNFPNCTKRKIIRNGWSISSDGYLKEISSNTLYPPGSFCIKTEIGSAHVCIPPSNQIFAWKKCCKEDELLHVKSNSCIAKKNTSYFRPKFNETLQIVSEQVPICSTGTKLQRYSTENCESSSTTKTGSFNRYLLENSVENEYNCRFRLREDFGIEYESSEGLFLRKSTWKKLHPGQQYCLDGTFDDPSISCERADTDATSKRDRCEAERLHAVLLVCDSVSVSEENSNRSKTIFLAATWSSTCPLLLFAAVVNFLFVQKNVHGWTLTAYLISMCLVNIASVILVLEERSDGCRVIDFFLKFIYFSTLCWMTSINFSLWRTFRRASPKKTSPKRFLFYLVFCTGFPIFVVTLSYFMGKKNPCDDPKKQVQCALYNHETLPFYSGPVIGMIVLNLILFLRTTFRIMGLRNETSAVLHKTNKDNLESFRLFTKLFLMTGSIWVIRVVLLVLQVKGLYFTWYGVALEVVFSTPEAVFPIILLLHPEFIKWVWINYPRFAKTIHLVIPCFRVRRTEIGVVSFNNGTVTPSA